MKDYPRNAAPEDRLTTLLKPQIQIQILLQVTGSQRSVSKDNWTAADTGGVDGNWEPRTQREPDGIRMSEKEA